LLPFEEAKLYGHNAVHALCAYVGRMKGVNLIAELTALPQLMGFFRDAFLEESGEALIRKHAGVDALFTRGGYMEYADDLLARMVNPFLRDTVDRVGRDPERKLGWNDRLIGTIRLALSQGVRPWRFAAAAAAALSCLQPAFVRAPEDGLRQLQRIWGAQAKRETEAGPVLQLVEEGFTHLRQLLQAH
jgi:mannitol-1-phosphate 5-dehydrogenase